ncbi:A/G-specific adenine glycosylase [Carnobacterium sp. PL17GRE32]|uniref:A/G-specific adenine glycosylase n=1 Tax=Carnobacterium sp. PL17GRE32 TaxID=2592355 RepID=UPI0011EEA1CC|nr:A/G-specific adenine glycosylase [Carnobacterium sp. PL17GRE32]KAF3304350.1 A/G-specific adenine glycosylase [Carnobacterium sp. PL17GRE32]
MTEVNQDIDLSLYMNESAIQDLGPVIEGVQVWGPVTNQDFRKTFLDWYDKESRRLPWRESKDPYRIWVSEIMLQQTRVDTVIGYYARFLSAFPTIKALAEAEEDQLLKVWEGLGYYSRVRNMQAAAQQIMADHDGIFPDNLADIKKLKGIGPYTAGAIGSIAFGIPVPAIDGNAMRVISRLFMINADIQKPANRKIFEAVGQYLVDPDRPGDFNQAIMDLGSSFETPKKAMPELSPLRDFTMATLTRTTDNYPIKSKKAKAKPVYYQALILQNAKGQVLIEKRTQHKLLNNLWTVPLINLGTSANQDLPANEKTAFLLAESQEAYGISPIFMRKEIGQVKHVFTHLIWHILLTYGQLKPVDEKKINDMITSGEADYAWVAPHHFEDYAFPTVQMKVWQAYEDYQKDNHHNIK